MILLIGGEAPSEAGGGQAGGEAGWGRRGGSVGTASGLGRLGLPERGLSRAAGSADTCYIAGGQGRGPPSCLPCHWALGGRGRAQASADTGPGRGGPGRARPGRARTGRAIPGRAGLCHHLQTRLRRAGPLLLSPAAQPPSPAAKRPLPPSASSAWDAQPVKAGAGGRSGRMFLRPAGRRIRCGIQCWTKRTGGDR